MTEPTRTAPRRLLGLVARWVFLAAAVTLAGLTLARQWTEVQSGIAAVGWGRAALAVLAGCAAIACSGEQQRVLLASAGTRIPARSWVRVFYVAQLGKYLPGSAWAYVAQMELSRVHGARRASSVLTMVLGAALTVLSAFVVSLPAVVDGSFTTVPLWLQWSAVIGSGLALGAVVLWPRIAVDAVEALASRVRRWAMPRLSVDGRPVRLAVLWSFAAWVGYGVQMWVLVEPLGAPGASGAALALGSFALAWVCGFLFVIAPAGIGVREAVLVAVLGPVIGAGAALAAALLSRFLIIAAEIVLAGLAGLVRAPRPAELP